MELLEREEICESSLFKFLYQVVVQLQFFQTRQISERVSSNHRNSVLRQHQRFEAEKVHKRFFLEFDDRIVVEPKSDEGRKVPEAASLDHREVVVAEVEVLQLGHVDEGAADLDDSVVRNVQRWKVSQSVECVSWKWGLKILIWIRSCILLLIILLLNYLPIRRKNPWFVTFTFLFSVIELNLTQVYIWQWILCFPNKK